MGTVKVGRRRALTWLLLGSVPKEMAKWCHLKGFSTRGEQFQCFSALKSEVFGRKLIDLFSKSAAEAIITNAVETLHKYNVHLTTLPIT